MMDRRNLKALVEGMFNTYTIMVETVKRYIDACTGRYVTKVYAEKHPSTTVCMKVKIGRNKHQK